MTSSSIPPLSSAVQPILNTLTKKAKKESTPQQKEEMGKFLSSIYQNYKKNSPFYSAPGFLTTCAEKFMAIFRSIFGFSPSFPLSAIEAQFAMHLFRTCDANLVAKAGSDTLPFSYIIETWARLLKETSPAGSSKESAALFQCASFQKSIERARDNAHPLWRNGILFWLKWNIKSSINKLKEGEVVYIPGGYLEADADQNKKPVEMLYEVRKQGAQYTFRLIHNSDIGAPMEKTFVLKKEKLFEKLGVLIEVQSISNVFDNNKGLYRYYWRLKNGKQALAGAAQLAKAAKSDLNTVSPNTRGSEAKESLSNLSSLAAGLINSTASKGRLSNVLQELNEHSRPSAPNAKVRNFSANKSDEKVMELFLKCKDEEHFALHKMGMKLALFFDLFDKTKANIQTDEKWRLWCRDTGLNLIADLKRKAGDSDDLKEIKVKLEEIVNLVSDPVNEKSVLPPAPQDQKAHPNIFSDPIIFSQKDISIADYIKTAPKSTGSLSPLKPEELNFENLLASCAALSEERKLDELRLRLNDAYLWIFKLDREEHWKELSIVEREEWSASITQLVKYSIQVNLGNDEKGPLPQQLLQMFKGFEICQRLAWMNNEKTKFEGFHFNMDPFRDILKDPYLDLGSAGPELIRVMNKIDASNENKVLLTSLAPANKEEKAFFALHEEGCASKNGLHQDLGDNDLLPPNIVHLRQLNLLLMMSTARYRTLHHSGMWIRGKAAVNGAVNFMIDIVEKNPKPSLKMLPQHIQKIDEALQQSQAPNTFSFERYLYWMPPTAKIEPHGVHVHNYNETNFQSKFPNLHSTGHKEFINTQFPSVYKGTGPSIQTEGIDERVITGVVANQDDEEAFEDGTEAFEWWSKREERFHFEYGPAGNKKTERSLLDEQFRFLGQPFDTSADLQLMQTNPLVTRIPNTLGCFVRSSGLLGDPKTGSEWQRVMSLNLFRNGALHQFLQKRPEYKNAVANSLISIGKQLEYSNHIEGVLFMIHLIEQALPMVDNEVLNKYYGELVETLTVWHKKAGEDKSYKLYKREIHQAFLLALTHRLKDRLADPSYDLSQDSEVQENLQRILKSHCVTKQIPEPKDRLNLTDNEKINYMIYRLLPSFSASLEKEETRNQWLNSICKEQVKTDEKWTHQEGSCFYSAGKWSINIEKGLLYNEGVARCPMPARVTTDPLCIQFFGNKLQEIVDHWVVDAKGSEGHVYEVMRGGNKFRILLLSGENPIIFKKTAEKSFFSSERWSQLQLVSMSYSKEEKDKGLIANSLSAFSRLFNDSNATNTAILKELNKEFKGKDAPCALSEYYFWVDQNGVDFWVENRKEELLFTGKADIKNSTAASFKWPYALKRMIGNVASDVINPWTDRNFDKFLAMDRPSQILAMGPNSKVEYVKYHRFGLEYKWNEEAKQWQSPLHKGYFLSNKKGEELLRFREEIKEGDHKNPTLFASTFRNYHILEHSTKPAKLHLVGEEYKKTKPQTVAEQPTKNIKKTVEPVRSNSGGDFTELYTFDIDPVQGLKSKSAEGYLYLSYVLFTQSKYAEAIHYLRKAQDIRPKISENTDKIIGWFEKWESNSPRAKTVLMHVQILKLEQLKTLHTKPPLTAETQNTLNRIMSTYKEYSVWKAEGKIEPQLFISPKQRGEMLYSVQIVRDDIKAQIDRFGNLLGITQGGRVFFDTLNTFLDLALQENADEKDALSSEIDSLRKQITENKKKAVPNAEDREMVETPVFEGTENLFKRTDDKVENPLTEQKEDLRESFAGCDTYTRELGEGLIADLEKAMINRQESEAQFVEGVNLEELQLASKNKELEKEALQKKRAIIESLSLNKLKAGSLAQIRQSLKEEDATKEKFFEEALFAYAANDWHDLIQQRMVTPNQIQGLEALIEDFLIVSTKKQQYDQALILMEKLKEKPDAAVSAQLAALLSTKRHYDPKNDPYKRACLMLEYDSKIIARKSQIKNVHDMLKKENVFKHEALAGGKTTVLRNIITKIKANGVNLSGVITHDPLIEMHHALYENTATHAYGDKAIRFEFSRKDPTDTVALKAVLRNLLKTVVAHGRIDMTKKDILSFHHTYLMKYEALEKAEDRLEELQTEIDLMAEIFTLFREHCRIGSDELDKVCDPEKEHNYATGDKTEIDRVKKSAAFEMVKWLLGHEKYKEIFKSNTQYRLTDEESVELRKWLAEQVSQKYLGFSKPAAIHYFTGIGTGDSTGFYQRNIERNPDKETLKAFQKFLSEVIAGPISHRGGVTYGRSKDLVLVKPFEGNGDPAEHSEHGTEEEVIWYTCLNYMDQTLGGVREDQIAQIVIEAQSKVSRSILQTQQIDPNNPIDYEQTAQAIEFKRDFGLNLKEITPSDYKTIADSINQDPEKLVRFLEERVFSQMSLRREKIVGNSSDLVELYKEFYGSSGTSNISLALPDKIVKDPELIKQAGVDGAILLALLKDYKEGDIIELEEGKDPAEAIAGHLGSSNGNGLIDLAPAFPGKLAKEIVDDIAKYTPDNQFRYMDKDNTVQLYNDTNKTTTTLKENLEEEKVTAITTVYDKGHTRGTDLIMANHSVGYVTLSADTKFSDFLQAVMRMRKLGRGQTVRYLIDKGVKKRMGGQMTLGHLIAMTVDNEAKGLKNLHLKSEKQAIKAIAKSAIFAQLHGLKREERASTWKQVRKFFIQETQESLDSIGRPKTREETPGVLKEFAQAELDKVASVNLNLEGAREALAKKASGETLISEVYLPSHTFKGNFDQDMQQEVEKEQEQEQEQEQEMEQQQEQTLSRTSDKGPSWVNLFTNSIDVLIWSGKNTNAYHQLQRSVPFYDETIYFTENFSHQKKGMKLWGTEQLSEKIPPNQMRHSRFVMVVEKRTKKVSTFLGTAKDFDHVFENLDRKDPRFDYFIYNLDRNDFDGYRPQDYDDAMQKKLVRAIVQVKLLNGDVELLRPDNDSVPVIKQEYETFKEFLKEKMSAGLLDPKVLQENLRKYLANLRPTLAVGYSSSPMAKAFKDVMPSL